MTNPILTKGMKVWHDGSLILPEDARPIGTVVDESDLGNNWIKVFWPDNGLVEDNFAASLIPVTSPAPTHGRTIE